MLDACYSHLSVAPVKKWLLETGIRKEIASERGEYFNAGRSILDHMGLKGNLVKLRYCRHYDSPNTAHRRESLSLISRVFIVFMHKIDVVFKFGQHLGPGISHIKASKS